MRVDERANEWREELLRRLSPTVRPRVEGNGEYEDLLALMAAWLQATDEHISATEEKVVTRLSAELAPGGDWKFPVQTLAIPRELKTRGIEEDTRFQGSGGLDDQWRPCGAGWTRPTALADWHVDRAGGREHVLVCQIRSDRPDMKLLLPAAEAAQHDGQQLAYVCGDDDLVSALATAPWAIQNRGDSVWHPVTATRYQDYFRFERGIGGARARQRQLATWLPPFYPYSRKFLRFALSETATDKPEIDWSAAGRGGDTIRLAARINDETARKLQYLRNESVEAARSPLILNAVPVAQMQMQAEELLGSPFKTNDGYARPVTGVWGSFAASIQETYSSDHGTHTVYPATGLTLGPVDFNAIRQDEQSALITCGPQSKTSSGYQARLYYGCRGHDISSPRELSRGPQVFTTPFPALGGKNAPVADYGDAGSRHAWYHAYLRAPQPTEADITEILNQIPSCREYLALGSNDANGPNDSHDSNGYSGYNGSSRRTSQKIIQLDIDNRPRAERSAWENYLWPTLVSEETLLEMRASFLSSSEVAIMPRMRLHFRKRKNELPTFLWREIESYAASVLSQYFMIGWYRLEGVVGDA